MSQLSLVTTSSEPETPPLAVGETLGVYVIEQVLGEGSMGRVYLGRHQRLGRQVALKVLHGRLLADHRLVQRFLQEGRVVNQINHEHIVEVHDFVEELLPERVYCVMEFLRGETLSQRLATRASALDSIRTIGRQLASALGAAHAVGVVHRDLKPDNVFLMSRDGRDDWVKVLDFGVAKSVPLQGEVSVVESQQGTLLGTPRYMAPEQVAGLEVDARTDVYALGTILYELLSGRPPFDSGSFGQLAADIITAPPPALPKHTALGEAIPTDLAALTMACLAKQASDRPASMAVVDAALAGQQALEKKKSRLPLLAAGVVSMLMGAGLVLALRSPPAEVAQPQPVPVVAQPPVKPPEPAAPTEVTLAVTTSPGGAFVTRTDTGAVLGKTPFEVKVARGSAELPLRIELAGHDTIERRVVVDQSRSLEVTLQAVAKPKPRPSARPVTDGVLDPF